VERKPAFFIFTLALLAAAAGSISPGTGDKAWATVKSATPKESCITGECHAKMGTDKYVHGPVAAGECTSCHKPIRKHKFEPISDIGKLCEECHEKLDKQRFVHAPVRDGKCFKCHDPHQSPNKFQLRAAGSDLCFLCHDKSIAGGKFVHGPVAVGSCSTCHSVHQSDFAKLLRGDGNKICFECHADKAEALKNRKFIHAPAQIACVQCHNPHNGEYRYNFKAEGSQDLCFTCHADKAKDIAGATVKHKGLDTAKKCLACHDPHVSDYVKQLTLQPADLCMSCHDKEYVSKAGRVANMKDIVANNSIYHGPIKQKDCSSCHNTHGSKNFRMLRENFPPVFYAGYDPDNYKLCFMCHEKSLANDEKTTKLTAFRNGEKNLHFVHVNRATKGRTCRACHDAHATNNPRHVRDAVPFASWQLPVGFQKTDTGGQCLPGCHKMFGYDRNKAVLNK
jgi:predicted CXXCH cytochrome family protein